jgi:nucleoside-diphosphate-sugar epimerase
VTRLGVIRLTRPVTYSTSKARAQLGWHPRVDPTQALRSALQWYLEHESAANKHQPRGAQLAPTT